MCQLTLFGAPALECDGQSQHLSRRKARALLAYLAVTGQSHTRESLVALLWPEYGEREGRADLSRMLSVLRNALGKVHFVSDRESVALDEEADLWVDVVHFRRQIAACREQAQRRGAAHREWVQNIEAAVALYQADFMAGFTLPDCPAFDRWQRQQSEALRRDLSWALRQLVRVHDARHEPAQAIEYAQQWVALDPLHEPAQRRLMALYARNGQRAAAHRQYEACKRVLAEELGVEPQPETSQLYEQIRAGSVDAPPGGGRLSQPAGDDAPPLAWPADEPESRRPFVGREQSLARLYRELEQALAGNGRVLFVSGDAGRGKTSLLEAFAQRAQADHPDLIVSSGSCNAIAGAGDPYLPFREVLRLLAGDVAPHSTVSRVSREQSRRLWRALPQTAQAIVEHGPQLIDAFISGRQLLARATAVAADAGWLVALRTEVARRQEAHGELEQSAPADLGGSALVGQVTNVLLHLARQHPLLIILDDVQWIDRASIALLFHLGRRLHGARILLVAAYRPDELAPDRKGQPHPLRQVLDEFRRQYGDVVLDLDAADRRGGRAFIDALIDTEGNRLDSDFRQALFDRTGGHPLFTVELLLDMQSRGALVQDEDGRWRAGSELDWDTIPARVEAVIARRLDRLDDTLHEILTVASVEGERFTAEVVARVLGLEERALLRALSQRLEKEHHLVRERGEIEVHGAYLSSYRFRHALFQQYLYRQLAAGERRRLHGDVAGELEALYADELDELAVTLAHHYALAADWHKAVFYQSRSGDLAYQKGSLRDAAGHYRSALAHWPQADRVGRGRVLRKLGACRWMLGQHQEAMELLESARDLFQAAGQDEALAATLRLSARVCWEVGQADRAGELHEQALSILEGGPENEELAWALAGMASYHMHLLDYEAAVALGERALAIARRLDTDELIIQCLCDLGSALSGMGDWDGLALERESLERALELNRPHDAGRAYLYLAEGLTYLGRYDQARETLDEALAFAQRLHLPYIAESAQNELVKLEWLNGRWSDALDYVQEKVDQLDREPPPLLAHLYLKIILGRIYNDLGQAETAHELLAHAARPSHIGFNPQVAFLGELARAAMISGRQEQAVSAIVEILEWTDQARHLYPNIGRALLFICRAPVVENHSPLTGYAHAAWRQLQRLDRQFGTPVTAAHRVEGRGWLLLAQGGPADISQGGPAGAASRLEEAAARWRDLERPYDQARALDGLRRALLQAGDDERAGAAAEQAVKLVEALAAQLDDATLREAFVAHATAPPQPPAPDR
ncbi:MAG TPA: tetratricopeptide repeat protein [Candidatus Sulfomarinibacteraceae bacterium]|nr:tetratricopeptide repeat protein [Candidatus Sulfomarinibacteraceae bacterium]